MNVIYEGSTLLLLGTAMTVKLYFPSAAIAVVCALIAGLAQISSLRPVRVSARCYVELFRGTLLVVQLFWLYFALPFFGINLEAFQAAVIGLGLCFGAYGAEVVRGAIMAVPKGQVEAAVALSLSRFDRLRSIILPQAFVIMLPSVGNLLVLLMKLTATASLITVPELTYQAYNLNVRTYATVKIFATILVIYFLLSLVISRGIRLIERRAGSWRVAASAR